MPTYRGTIRYLPTAVSAAALLLMGAPALAVELGGGATDSAHSNSNLAIGEAWTTISAGSTWATAVGSGAHVAGANSSAGTAIGFDAKIGMDVNGTTPGTSATPYSTAVGSRSWIVDGAYSSTALGNETRVMSGAYESTVIGQGARASEGAAGATVLGHSASVSADVTQGVALGQGAQVDHSNSVALGAGSITTRGAQGSYQGFGIVALQGSVGEVAVGTDGGQRTITGVAAGRDAHDAVNVQQLQAVSSNVASIFGGGSTVGSNGVITAPTYTVQGTDYHDVGSAFSAVDYALGDLGARITTEAGQAGAVGIAAASLRFDDRPGKISVAAGGGHWGGENAFALGGGYTSDDQSFRANITGTSSGGNWGVGAGVSLTLN